MVEVSTSAATASQTLRDRGGGIVLGHNEAAESNKLTRADAGALTLLGVAGAAIGATALITPALPLVLMGAGATVAFLRARV